MDSDLWRLLAVTAGPRRPEGQEIKHWAEQQLTASMFVASDTDAFDPGLKIGERFPLIEARLNQTIVHSIDPLIADKGLIFIASRSVDW